MLFLLSLITVNGNPRNVGKVNNILSVSIILWCLSRVVGALSVHTQRCLTAMSDSTSGSLDVRAFRMSVTSGECQQ